MNAGVRRGSGVVDDAGTGRGVGVGVGVGGGCGGRAGLVVKRGMDLVGSGLGMLVLMPLGLMLALVIKLSDGGPVLYGHERVGRGGRPFRLWKFRSMVPNADRVGPAVTRDGDPRVTRIGRWLRRTKLDELPQLWNVWVGEMSLVGPRPEAVRYVAAYTAEEREVLAVRPGITDAASLAFRDEEGLLAGAGNVEDFYLRYCLPRKLALNRAHLRRGGVMADLGVLVRSAGLVAGRILGGGGESRGGSMGEGGDGRERVAVVGTGEWAAREVDALRRGGGIEVVGLFDDDAEVWHRERFGVGVVGMPEILVNAGWRERIDRVVLVAGDLGMERAEVLRGMLEGAGVACRVAGPGPG